MAGDWIKFEHATLDKSEVLRIADLLGISRREAIGLLMDFWVWLDRNVSNANSVTFVTHMSRKSIDELTHCAGFAACLVDVGWATIDDQTGILTITNGERHNGNPAKTRALGKDRVTRLRNASVTQTPLPEKRREDIKPTREASRSTSKPVDNSGNGVDWTDPRSVDAYGKRIGKPCRPGESIARYAARLRGAA